MMQLWPTQALERHVATLQDAIKKGVTDPDADARLMSRKYVSAVVFTGKVHVLRTGPLHYLATHSFPFHGERQGMGCMCLRPKDSNVAVGVRDRATQRGMTDKQTFHAL